MKKATGFGLLAAVQILFACARQPPPPVPTPAPTASVAASSAPSAEVVDACAVVDVARIKANVPLLKPGMTRAQVNATLGNDLSCFGGGGQGSPAHFLTMHRLDASTVLGLTWETKGDAAATLVAAELAR